MTFDQQLDHLLEANIRHNTCKEDKQEQLRTMCPPRKDYKGNRFGSRIANARNADNRTIEGFEL
jgi:hypothetical protein